MPHGVLPVPQLLTVPRALVPLGLYFVTRCALPAAGPVKMASLRVVMRRL